MKAEREAAGEASKCIFKLIEKGCNINLKDNDGCTVLDIAARYGQSEHLAYLVKAGIDPNTTSSNGFTPLHWSANAGSDGCLKILLGLGKTNPF